jgi:hypothetical protein
MVERNRAGGSVWSNDEERRCHLSVVIPGLDPGTYAGTSGKRPAPPVRAPPEDGRNVTAWAPRLSASLRPGVTMAWLLRLIQ